MGTIKGYNVPDGYMGYISTGYAGFGYYMLFACEGDYLDYVKEN